MLEPIILLVIYCFLKNGGGMQCCNDSFPDGKTRRRESRRRAIRRRKGRL